MGSLKRTIALILLVVSALAPRAARAHGLNTSQLRLHLAGSRLDGDWELLLRDARVALGLDPELTGEPGFSELREHEAALRAYLAGQLRVSSNQLGCKTVIDPAPIAWHPEQAQIVLKIAAVCPAEPRELALRSDLLFDREPGHRAYFWLEDARVTHVGVLTSGHRTASIDVHQFHPASGFLEFVREGVHHIWSGLDHLLFLLALLLPAALVREADHWSRRATIGATLREILKVVTAFTAAHSLTLCLAFFGLVTIPSRWVEALIAVSVFAAAWNNLRPFLPGRAWTLAFGFGLIHGLGFAGALRNLELPLHARWLALLAFNVGVELGQLAIVIALLPLLQAASKRIWYERWVMGSGSLVIAWLAALWILERGFGFSLGLA